MSVTSKIIYFEEYRNSPMVKHPTSIHLSKFRILTGTFAVYVEIFFSCVFRLFSPRLCWSLMPHWLSLYYILLLPCLLKKKHMFWHCWIESMLQPYIYPYKFPVDPHPRDQLIYLNQLFKKIYISHDNPNGFVAFVYCIAD